MFVIDIAARPAIGDRAAESDGAPRDGFVHDGSVPGATVWFQRRPEGWRAVTGGAQRALSAAINLHHAAAECVTADMFLGMRWEHVCVRACVFIIFLTEDI